MSRTAAISIEIRANRRSNVCLYIMTTDNTVMILLIFLVKGETIFRIVLKAT